MQKRTFYSVTTSAHNEGTVHSMITSTKAAERKPEREAVLLKDKSIFVDWFDSYEEAEKFADEVNRRNV